MVTQMNIQGSYTFRAQPIQANKWQSNPYNFDKNHRDTQDGDTKFQELLDLVKNSDVQSNSPILHHNVGTH